MQVLSMPRVAQPSPVFPSTRPASQPFPVRTQYAHTSSPPRAVLRPCPSPEPVDASLPRDIASRFGRRVRALRQARSMTQIEVSVHFGIDRTFISDVERGRKSVCLPTMEVFALGFGLSLSDLLRGI